MRLLMTTKVISRAATLIRALSSKAAKTTGSSQSSKSASSTQSTSKPSTIKSDGAVPGLSANVLVIPETEVGPGASKKSLYKNPEYFTYHAFSYAEAEVEMIKFRLPQPSNKARQ